VGEAIGSSATLSVFDSAGQLLAGTLPRMVKIVPEPLITTRK
jgi:hypothetical protein